MALNELEDSGPIEDHGVTLRFQESDGVVDQSPGVHGGDRTAWMSSACTVVSCASGRASVSRNKAGKRIWSSKSL